MADKKLNDLAQIPSIGSLKNIYVEDAYGNQYKVSKESLAEVLGGLILKQFIKADESIKDWNTFKQDFGYASGRDAINSPRAGVVGCIVMKISNSEYYRQIAFSPTDSLTYTRCTVNTILGTWSEWIQFVTK